MSEPVYTISQASDLVGKKSYVLRYWEEELGIPIARNEMGHRYYTGNDIQLFLNIKELQKRGLQLRAIKDLIPKLYWQEPGSSDSPIQLLPGQQEAAATSDSSATDYISSAETSHSKDSLQSLDSYKMQEFQSILEKLISQGLKDKKAQEREKGIRHLDQAIRFHQQSRRQAAATTVSSSRRRPFGRKKK